MRSRVLVGLAAALCAVFSGVVPATARDLVTGIDLDYTYTQENVGGDVDAETKFNQKYTATYTTSLTTTYDFVGAVRLELQDSWSTTLPGTSLVGPSLELGAKGSQAAAKLVYEMKINATDATFDAAAFTSYSTNLSFDLEMTVPYWPDVKLKLQQRRDLQENSKDTTTNSFEFSARKDIYGLRLEYSIKRDDEVANLPDALTSSETTWVAKATYKEVVWGGTEFELAYEINETYGDDQTRGVFSGETSTYNQILKTRFKNSLDIGPRMKLDLSWEYNFDQDLLSLDYDYKVKNTYILDLRWDAYEWLKFSSEGRRETDLTAAIPGEDDVRGVVDTFKAAFDLTSISWMRVSGKAELKRDDKVAAATGGSVDKIDEEKYELIAKNVWGDFWDFTWDAASTITHTDEVLTDRETRVKADLKLKLLNLSVTPGYEVSRVTGWEEPAPYPISQKQTRDARVKFDYQMQLADMIKATFSHEYTIKVEDTLDEVLNFERLLQFTEDTRLVVVLGEIIRNLNLEGEIDRKASDTEDDIDPQLVELTYALKLDWKLDYLNVVSSFKYNDKGDTFDDWSFNAKASYKYGQLELSGEYQYDKIIKEITEPKDEKRKLSLKLGYRF